MEGLVGYDVVHIRQFSRPPAAINSCEQRRKPAGDRAALSRCGFAVVVGVIDLRAAAKMPPPETHTWRQLQPTLKMKIHELVHLAYFVADSGLHTRCVWIGTIKERVKKIA